MNIEWNRLLSPERVPVGGQQSPKVPANQRSLLPKSAAQDFRSAFEADYDRVAFSTSFRRLARKTQVHPLAQNDQVHNRLTHSIEVAAVGRTLSRMLTDLMVQRNEPIIQEPSTRDDLAWILQAACLVHDIGNPPFGHAGEFAIREWSAEHADVVFPDDHDVSPGTQSDVRLFEGNAQGFRLAARTDNQQGYMRLTYATLGAMVKYPWTSTTDKAVASQKYNCFSTEQEIFHATWEQLGLIRDDGTYARHPLSFLSEAADDICYRIVDLEDAAEMQIIDESVVRDAYNRFLGESTNSKLPVARGKVIRRLMEKSFEVFENEYDTIMRGEREDDLKSDFPEELRDAVKNVKQIYNRIFSHRDKITTELGAYKALGRIIKALAKGCQALATNRSFADTARKSYVAKRSLELAWDVDYLTRNESQSYDWWLHEIMDFVSSLTDNSARQISSKIAGL